MNQWQIVEREEHDLTRRLGVITIMVTRCSEISFSGSREISPAKFDEMRAASHDHLREARVESFHK